MIQTVNIKNYKSVVDLSIDLGAFNVLIGENGCGKTNILEAIAFGAAASADKLDYEFLGSRGIRVTNPEFMYSAFPEFTDKKLMEIEFKTNDTPFGDIKYVLRNEINNPKKWKNIGKEIFDKSVGDEIASMLFDKNKDERKKELEKIFSSEKGYVDMFESFADHIQVITEKEGAADQTKGFFKFIFDKFLNDRYFNEIISNYIVYSPEQSSLRKFEETTQIYPLGIKGEGLFQYIKELAFDKTSRKTLRDIKKNLLLLNWYESFDLPDNLMKNEFSLEIKDKYLDKSLKFFDQRSTNEGFLYLLFYSTLFISNATPSFFAIDNIDSSFNPKLCMQLTRNLAQLASKNSKQVIVTTQNPAILDGLNLKDDNQRLFVVSRNLDGHTRIERINHNKKRTMKLSEIWTKGFIGGLPENF